MKKGRKKPANKNPSIIEYDKVFEIEFAKYSKEVRSREKISLELSNKNAAYLFGWESWAQYLVRRASETYHRSLIEDRNLQSFSYFSFNEACIQLGMALELIYKILYIKSHKKLEAGHLNDKSKGIEFFHRNLTFKNKVNNIISFHGWKNCDDFFESAKKLNYINRRYWDVPKTQNKPESLLLISSIDLWPENDPNNRFTDIINLCDDLLCLIYDSKDNAYVVHLKSTDPRIRVGLESLSVQKTPDQDKDKPLVRISRSFIYTHGLGLNFMIHKNYHDAIDAFENLLKINPRHIETAINLVLCYHNTGQIDKAYTLLKKCNDELDLKSYIDNLDQNAKNVLKKLLTLMSNAIQMQTQESSE